MALSWGICLPGGAVQTGRKVRFAIDYKSFPFNPVITSSMKSRYGFVDNRDKKRMSILVNPQLTRRCDFTTKLMTEDPIAEIFYNEFIEAQLINLPQKTLVTTLISYYVFDESGTDIPLVPNKNDITSATGIDEFSNTLKSFGFPVLILGGLYFGRPYLKKLFKKKGKR